MNIHISRSIRSAIVLSCALSLSTPTHGISFPKLSIPSSCIIEECARITAAAAVIASLTRLLTKKMNPIAYPKDDSFIEWARYLIDEQLIGVMGKGVRLDNINLVTGDCKYKKLEPRGVMGIIGTNFKDNIVPIFICASLFFEYKGKFAKGYTDLLTLFRLTLLPGCPALEKTPPAQTQVQPAQ